MATLKKLAFFVLFLAPAASADWWDHGDRIRGEGQVKQETREVGTVDAVELATFGTLFIERGETTSLLVVAQENLLEYFETDVRSGMLVIRTRPRVNLQATEPVEFYLTVPHLDEVILGSSGDAFLAAWKADKFFISVESSGDFECDELVCPVLDIDLESSGDVLLRSWQGESLRARLSSSGDCKIDGGTAREIDVEIHSSGNFKASGLLCESADVSTSSSGDAVVRVKDYLKARSSSSGDVVYYGDPEVDGRASSSGDIVKRGL